MPLPSTAVNFWSNTDFPYHCLRDTKRTLAFQAAIYATVRANDIVVDAGSGSGVLAMFAAKAGAKRVYAVEVDSLLASLLRDNVRRNNLGDVIKVIDRDVRDANLPKDVDVVICEMMETGLLDEAQVAVINGLRVAGVITQKTKLIPSRYETGVELGSSTFSFYDLDIRLPHHNWPHLSSSENGWLEIGFHPLTKALSLQTLDFSTYVVPKACASLRFTSIRNGIVNAVRLFARAELSPDRWLPATNTLNGDKILPVTEKAVSIGLEERVHVSYEMGAGLGSFRLAWGL